MISIVLALDNLAIIGMCPSPIAIAKEIMEGPNATTNIRANRKNGKANSTSIIRWTIRSILHSFIPQYMPIVTPRTEEIASDVKPITKEVLIPCSTLLKISRPNPSVPR